MRAYITFLYDTKEGHPYIYIGAYIAFLYDTKGGHPYLAMVECYSRVNLQHKLTEGSYIPQG
jgi:hypothetical protein